VLLKQNLAAITSGGRWSEQFPDAVRSNMRWFYLDGLFATASDTIPVTYLTLYLLALGATSAQIGWMTALSALSATIFLLPGAFLAERSGKRKLLVLMGGGGVYRITLLLLAVLPFFMGSPEVIFVVIALKVIGDGFANMGLPAWTSMTGDIVPLEWRGRYFGNRNMVLGVTGMVVTFLMGAMITRMGSPIGYQVAYGIAFVIGMIATYCFAHINEPKMKPVETHIQTGKSENILQALWSDRNFMIYCGYVMIWNFSINIAGPFFNVYLVQELNATAALVGTLSIVSGLAGLPATRFFGNLSDRWGPRRVQMWTGLIIPVMPLAWMFVNASWQVIPINILGGILWTGFGLASFNFMLMLSKPEHIARYSAVAQISVAISTAGGAALGGMIAQHWGYIPLFALSGVGRFIGALVFVWFVKQPKEHRIT
jgi:MFS family permease